MGTRFWRIVIFNFAGSNQLAAQIAEGAPADVFGAADAAQMAAAVESGRIDAGAARRLDITNGWNVRRASLTWSSDRH